MLLSLVLLAAMQQPLVSDKHEISKDTRIELLQAQHELDSIQNEINNLRAQITQLQQGIDNRNAAAKAQYDFVLDKAYKEAGEDKTKVDFDIKTFKFTPKPKAEKASTK